MFLVALAGCGGDDDTSTATTSPPDVTAPDTTEAGTAPATSGAPATTAPDSGSAGDGPNATVSPDLPDAYEGEVGPVEVQGTSLPEHDASLPSDPAVGMAAPIVIGQDFDGNTVRIDAAKDGMTLAVFLAHWCPHCNREVPRINELRDAGSFPADLNIVGVSTGISPDRPNWPPSQWFEDMDWTYPVIADGVDMKRQTFIAADAYGLDGFPFLTLIDSDGKVLARTSGEMEKEDLLKWIDDNMPQQA